MQITCLINLLSALPIDFPCWLNLQPSKNYFDDFDDDDDVDDVDDYNYDRGDNVNDDDDDNSDGDENYDAGYDFLLVGI